MKRITSIFLIACMLLGVLSGCGKNNGKQNEYSGKEIAKLLLAGERMNAEDLEFSHVAEELAFFKQSEELLTYLASNGGNYALLGNYSGSSFEQECNMLSFFQSYMDNILQQAEMASESISYMKENVGFTDVWVETGNGTNGRTLLTVDANMETIFNDCDENLQICRRYTDENANDVYEILQMEKSDGTIQYLYYCPGHWYEMGIRYGDRENEDLFIVIENTRGYWNMFTTYWINDPTEVRTNTQNLIDTGDSCFVNFGSIYRSGYVFENQTSVTDAGKNCDLLTISDLGVRINLAAFDGIVSVETDDNNFITSLTTNSGMTLIPYTAQEPTDEPGDMEEIYIHNGNAMMDRIMQGTLELAFNIETSPAERVQKALAYLAEQGITCKFETDSIIANANNAVNLGNNFASYYSWNGYPMSNLDNVELAMEADSAKHQVLLDAYEEIKDNKTVEMTSKGVNYLGYDFAKVGLLASSAVTFENGTVKVDNMQVSINNLAVMDAGEKYTVHLALAKLDDDTAQGNLKSDSTVESNGVTLVDVTGGSNDADYTGAVIMATTDAQMTEYSSGDAFALTQTANFTLPQCSEEGVYTIVAYVATEDGIRISEMVPVPFTSEVVYVGDTENGFHLEMYQNSYSEVIAVYSGGDVFVAPEEKKDSYTYAEVKALLENEILKHGLVIDGAVIEIFDPNTGNVSPVSEDQTFTNEICRMKYSFKADNSERYIYLLLGE